MSFRPPVWLVRGVGLPLAKGWAATWRTQVLHQDRWDAFHATPGPRMVFLWHETLLPLLLRHRGQGASIIVGRARDGRYLQRIAGALGYEVIVGSSHRGRVSAMRGTLRALGEGRLVAVTPDGPRGPRRVIKQGALLALAQHGGTALTAYATARPARRLGSWDRFLLPQPWSRIRLSYGRPLSVAPGTTDVPGLALALQRALAGLEQEAAW